MRFVNDPPAAKAVAAVVVVFCVTLLAGCASRPLETTVERRDVIAYVDLKGEIDAPATAKANVKSPYEAPIEQIYVTVGKSVSKGDVLIDLSAQNIEQYYTQARQRLQQARQQLEQARRTYGGDVSTARAQLDEARRQEREARAQGQADADEAAGQPAIDLTLAVNNRRQAEIALQDAIAIRDAAIVPYEQAVVEAQHAFQDAQGGRKQLSIRSPINGTVLEINGEIGETADPDDKTPLIVIVNLDAVKAYAPVDEDKLEGVRIESPAVVTSEDVPNQRFNGEVQELYSEKAGFLKGSQYVAAVKFANKQGAAKPGMKAAVLVEQGRAQDVLAVPNDAVFEGDNNMPAVNRKEGGQWVAVAVETGIMGTEYTEIISGLEEGDVVQANP